MKGGLAKTRSQFGSSEVVRELRQENENGASPRQYIDHELLYLIVIKSDCKRRRHKSQSSNPEPDIISHGTPDT
jgi:hypothetical protein